MEKQKAITVQAVSGGFLLLGLCACAQRAEMVPSANERRSCVTIYRDQKTEDLCPEYPIGPAAPKPIPRIAHGASKAMRLNDLNGAERLNGVGETHD